MAFKKRHCFGEKTSNYLSFGPARRHSTQPRRSNRPLPNFSCPSTASGRLTP
jgi:hypothetical protein